MFAKIVLTVGAVKFRAFNQVALGGTWLGIGLFSIIARELFPAAGRLVLLKTGRVVQTILHFCLTFGCIKKLRCYVALLIKDLVNKVIVQISIIS